MDTQTISVLKSGCQTDKRPATEPNCNWLCVDHGCRLRRLRSGCVLPGKHKDQSLKTIDVVIYIYIYIMLCLLQNLLLLGGGGLSGHVPVCRRVVVMACWHGCAYGPHCIIIIKAASAEAAVSSVCSSGHLCGHHVCVVIMTSASSSGLLCAHHAIHMPIVLPLSSLFCLQWWQGAGVFWEGHDGGW